MEWLKVYNWRKHQSYRTDRGAPPWIKVQRSLINHPKWALLSDAEKGALLSIWLIAADHDGEVPGDALILRKICSLDDAPDIEKYIDLGFLAPGRRQDGAKVAPSRRHAISAEAEAEAEGEADTETEKPRKRGAPADAGFDEWWEEYPNKVGKKPCREIWKRRRLGEKPGTELLVADLKRRKKSDRRFIEGFVPNPQTYLNQDRWTDALQPYEAAERDAIPRSNDDKLVAWARKRGIETRSGEDWDQFRRRIHEKLRAGAN